MGPAPRSHRGSWRVSDARRRFAAASDAARSLVSDFAADASGATAIEYALIAGLICVVIVGAINNLGTQMGNLFVRISSKMP
jgi:pilus assembly protein Flp/PilA